MRWNHTTSHISRIFDWRSYVWFNVVGCGCVLLLLWGWKLLIFGNCFAMGLRGTTLTSLLATGNSQNEPLLIASIILSQQIQVRRQITYLSLMTLIKKALCIPVGDSAIPVLILKIQRSARYRISQLLLFQLLLLVIRLQIKLNLREWVIIRRLGVTTIVYYLMEIYVWRGVSGTAISVWFGRRTYYCKHNFRYCFASHNDSLVRLPWYVWCLTCP